MAIATEVRYEPEALLTIADRPMPGLINGQLVEREPIGQRGDAIATRLICGLIGFAERRGLVNGGRCGFQIFPDDPSKVRVPSVAFTPSNRLPPEGPAEGHARVAPALIVEVIAPKVKITYLDQKIEDSFAAGVSLIWIINPHTHTILVLRRDRAGIRLRLDDVLDGEDVLSGFRLEDATLFEGIA